MRLCERWVYKSRGKNSIKNKIYYHLMRILLSCDIPPTIKMGDNVKFFHNGLGVVIHGKAKIGNNVKIYQNVTIGGNGKVKNGEKYNLGAPIIEDDVAIFCGACVLGPITIGKGSYIGANAVVTKDVPPNCLVVGNGEIKEKKYEYNFEGNVNDK